MAVKVAVPKSRSQGTAIYLEFLAKDFPRAWEVFISPAGYTTDGHRAPVTLHHREVTESKAPNWLRKQVPATATDITPMGKEQEDMAERLVPGIEHFRLIENLIIAHVKAGYTLRADTILYVETDEADMDAIAKDRNPWGIVNRFRKARKHVGFPTNSYDTSEGKI